MTDLRTILHDAAPVPQQPLDMRAVRARARGRRRLRLSTWLTGLGALLGIGVPTGLWLVPADRDGGGATVHAILSTTTTYSGGVDVAPGPTPTSTSPSSRRRDGGTRPGPSPQTSTSEASEPVPTTIDDSAPTEPGPPKPVEGEAAYPLAPTCVVDNIGLEGGGQRRCRFTATTKGGASMRTTGPVNPPPGSKGEVIVTRAGQSTTYDVSRGKVQAGEVGAVYCSAFIEPGDLVEAVFTNMPAPNGEEVTLGAGEGWECWQGTPAG